jgi:hypothetical protein
MVPSTTKLWLPRATSPLAMDITKFVVGFRESAFLLGDYSTYRAQVSRRLRIVQKKLGRATPKNAKYAAKAPVTAEDVGRNIEYESQLERTSQSQPQSLTGPGSCTFSSSPLSEHGHRPWP